MNEMLNKISEPIEHELNKFDTTFKESLDSDVKIINTVVRYIVRKKGKRLRPRLCLLSAQMCGEINKNTHIIDSPGIQEFGLHHISNTDLAWGFIEFHPYIGRCKFSDCLHINEPNCALDRAVQENKIDPRRLGFYRRLIAHKM